jgi:hypothetical protein
MWTDDPVSDAVGYFQELDDERERARACLPICAYCKEPMECDDLYDFDGVLVCENCVIDYIHENHKHRVDEYIDERYL